MDYVDPVKCMENLLSAGANKAKLSVSNMLIRGFLAGGLLAYATSLAFTASMQTNIPLVGAIVFPIGFIIIVLLGLELLTGNFALLPISAMDRRAKLGEICANFGWVFVGNLIGSVAFGVLLYHAAPTPALTAKLVALAEAKTTGYAAAGATGLLTCFTKAILCNWLVTMGAMLAATSTSTLGKSLACGMPIFMFFAHGFEHLIVNLFVIPTGMMMGANVSLSDWALWNLLPVTLGNLAGGFLLTGLPLYLTHRQAAKITRESQRLERTQLASREVPA